MPVQPASQRGWLLTRALGEQHGQLERMPNKESRNPQQYGPFLGNPTKLPTITLGDSIRGNTVSFYIALAWTGRPSR